MSGKSRKQSKPYSSVQSSSVAQSCPTLFDPMNRSTPGPPVHHQLPEFTQTHYKIVALSETLDSKVCFPRGCISGWGRSPGGGKGNPLQYSCLENSMNRGPWWATVHGVPKSGIGPPMQVQHPLAAKSTERKQESPLGLSAFSMVKFFFKQQ